MLQLNKFSLAPHNRGAESAIMPNNFQARPIEEARQIRSSLLTKYGKAYAENPSTSKKYRAGQTIITRQCGQVYEWLVLGYTSDTHTNRLVVLSSQNEISYMQESSPWIVLAEELALTESQEYALIGYKFSVMANRFKNAARRELARQHSISERNGVAFNLRTKHNEAVTEHSWEFDGDVSRYQRLLARSNEYAQLASAAYEIAGVTMAARYKQKGSGNA